MKNSISIPKPCHEHWDDMLPEDKGRHCLSCCKTVVDFSGWDQESILSYLQERKNERVCGRFNTEQLTQPTAPQHQELVQQVMRSRMPLLRKIAAVIVLCFGLLAGNDTHAQKLVGRVASPKQEKQQEHTKGKIKVQTDADTTKTKPVPQVDTAKYKPQIMGMIAPYHPPKHKPVPKTKEVKQVPGNKE